MRRWSFYFELGRWLFLVDTVCKSGERAFDSFWIAQPPIAEKIRAFLSEEAQGNLEAGPVLREFQALGAVLSEIARGTTSVTRGCIQVERHAARLEALLAAGGGAR